MQPLESYCEPGLLDDGALDILVRATGLHAWREQMAGRPLRSNSEIDESLRRAGLTERSMDEPATSET